MPSQSKAQFGKMGAMYQRGEISRKTLEHFNKGVDYSKLPAHKVDRAAKAAARKSVGR